jgi:hypothetical protein
MKLINRTPFILSLLIVVLLLGSAASAGQDVKFAWDPQNDPAVTGFKLYMASTAGVAVTQANLVATIPGSTVTTYTQLNTPTGAHYWVLTAYQGALESGPSNEVTYTVKPKTPTGLTNTITLTFGGVKVAVTKQK